MEIWKKWIPKEGIPTTFYSQSLVNDKEGLTLTFRDDVTNDKMFVVKFEGRVLSYRNTDEGSLSETLGYLTEQYGTEFYANWSLFEIENSEFLEWFLRQSSGIYTKEEIRHYVFFTSDDVIEVLSTYEPEILIETVQAK